MTAEHNPNRQRRAERIREGGGDGRERRGLRAAAREEMVGRGGWGTLFVVLRISTDPSVTSCFLGDFIPLLFGFVQGGRRVCLLEQQHRNVIRIVVGNRTVQLVRFTRSHKEIIYLMSKEGADNQTRSNVFPCKQ
ncbi:unnamed protein product [Onchocerca flexuosa]|uniref:Uncharacterized protein n=1 Tax=Onchocerca flexuosa TaxID=387005 RepID=A0A183HKF5_9BILA|nr:unnamed protein product [Onchocerca flexuosa]